MKRTALGWFVSAALILSASPALAADAAQLQPGLERHSGAFVGATLRFDFGRRSAPAARLGIGFAHSYSDPAGAVVARSQASALEIGLSSGRPELFVGGARVRDLERRLGATGSTTTLLVLGGLAVGAAALVMLSDDEDERDGPCPPGVEVCAQR
ncbi:MAG: hypothetical protein M3N07_02995 [Pseudomonadota bacterium]|nr:hypothetical protein [Pseudomonadota bacterium]